MPHYQWNDHTLFYRTQGEGLVLLILPGDTATSICYQGEMDYFSDRFCTVAPDFWGTGQSERLDVWPVNWWEQAAFQMGSLVDHLNIENCLVMGSSGGAIVALLMAIHFRRKCALYSWTVSPIGSLKKTRWKISFMTGPGRRTRSEDSGNTRRVRIGSRWSTRTQPCS